MITRESTMQDLSDFYSDFTPCESFAGITGLVDDKIVAISGLCFATGQPTIAISDFSEDLSKKDITRFGRLAMGILEDHGQLVWATCNNHKSRNVLEKLGFKFVSSTQDYHVMSWEPGPIDFYQLVDQLGLDSKRFTQSEVIDLISYGLDTQIPSIIDELEASAKRYFCNGVYIKEMLVPKGTLMVGKIHKTEHQCIMTRGDVSVMTQDKTFRLRGHNVFTSPKGVKRVGYFHEDTMWLNVHASNGIRNPDEMDDHLVMVADTVWIYDLLKEQK